MATSSHKIYFANSLEDFSGEIIFNAEGQKKQVEELVLKITENFKCVEKNIDGGLYTGLAGVSYMLYHLSKLPAFQSSKERYIEMALKYLDLPIADIPQVLKKGRMTRKTGFVTGLVGVYAMGAVLSHTSGNERKKKEFIKKFEEVSKILSEIDWNDGGGDELFVGRAGYLCGLLWMRREMKCEVIPDAVVFQILDTIIESGVRESKRARSNFPLLYHYHEKYYLGPAHGVSGILLTLLRFPDWLKVRGESQSLIRGSIDALLQQETPSGNFPSSLGSVRDEEDELIHWCHGAPGVVHLLVKAYNVYEDNRFLEAAKRCGEVTWKKGLLKKGPGLCHGLASSGYVFLLLYKTTNDKVHLHRGISFSNFFTNPQFEMSRTPDRPFSLFEGLAGFTCFSADLLHPELAEFPFLF